MDFSVVILRHNIPEKFLHRMESSALSLVMYFLPTSKINKSVPTGPAVSPAKSNFYILRVIIDAEIIDNRCN